MAIASSLLAIACLAALIAVAAIRNAGVLATVVLTLAVVSFLIQIVVFIAQTWTSGQQMFQSESLNAETKAMLAELRSETQGTQQVMAEHLKSVTEYAFEQARTAEKRGDSTVTVRDIERTVTSAIGEALGDYRYMPASSYVAPEPEPVPSWAEEEVDDPIVSRMRTWPSEDEAPMLIEALSSLSPLGVNRLRNFIDDEIRSRESGSQPGLPVLDENAPVNNELLENGLVESIPALFDLDQDVDWFGLTSRGREVGRLLAAVGPMPEYVRFSS